MKFDTKIIHQPLEQLSGTNRPIVMPIYQSVKFTADTFEELQDIFSKNDGRYLYSRMSNPTVRQLEVLLADLQGKDDCLCVGSGIAAVSAVLLSLLKSGDHVVMFYESYKPSRNLVTKILKKFGVTHSVLSITDMDSLEKAVEPGRTQMVLFESPTNPTTRIPDLERLTSICRKANCLSVIDNTFAGLHNHGEADIDLFIHSLTKFANGHGDTMGGAIIGSQQLVNRIRETCIDLGPTLDPNSAFLILRGMRTYSLRYERQVRNAVSVAEFLEGHKSVEKVMFPGLKSHPDHERGKKQLSDPGSIMTVYFKSDSAGMVKIMNSLRFFHISASVGSTECLIAPVEIFYGGDLSNQEKIIAEITPNAARLTIGIEDISDILGDLDQALGLGKK